MTLLPSLLCDTSTVQSLTRLCLGCNSIDIFLGPVSGPEPSPSHVWSFQTYLNFHWARNWATKLCQMNQGRPKQCEIKDARVPVREHLVHVLGRVLGTKLGQAQSVN